MKYPIFSNNSLLKLGFLTSCPFDCMTFIARTNYLDWIGRLQLSGSTDSEANITCMLSLENLYCKLIHLQIEVLESKTRLYRQLPG